ncbi:MAG TPA: DNA repair protein RecN [Burkholderiales bacterium]|nr:DNA repair protein RecN [Burkholderiales bacterium]
MLLNLQIKDFLLIEQLELDFFSGLTVITGETGSGKSIIIDALMLIFGAKAGTDLIRNGQTQASFSAGFQVDNQKVQEWLHERGFIDDDQENLIICRRVIDINGRSKAYINSQTVTLGTLKELGEMLLDIHTQHASIALLKPDIQRALLDEFAGAADLVLKLSELYRKVNQLRNKLAQAREFSQDLILKQEILGEKIHELEALGLGDQEWEALLLEQKQLANANFVLQELGFVTDLINGENNSLTDLSANMSNKLFKISEYLPNADQVIKLTESIEAEISELEHELNLVANKIEVNPEQLAIVDARIDEIYSLARKYRIMPEEILPQLARWQEELSRLVQDTDLAALDAELKLAESDYLALARQISQKRQTAAAELSTKVSGLLHSLAISGEFEVNVSSLTENWTVNGIDNIQYLVCFNQGMTLQPLNKVASGGELSRVALALYVTLSINNPPELIVFDEIDVGIGGGVAEVVGTLLRQLGISKQVICITHQPQAACCGDQHILVQKQSKSGQTQATIEYLDQERRVGEIARMLGGINITATTTSHAQEMLSGIIK